MHTVPYSHRSGERIEPLISLQWFMRMDELARPAIDVVNDGPRPDPSREPEPALRRLARRTSARGASRASSGGVTSCPVWYRGDDEIHVGLERARGRGLDARPGRARHLVQLARCGRSRRSAGPTTTPELRAFYPTDVLSTARDILFLWVARMVMMGLRFAGDVPFTDVYVHSVIQAPDGRRMSKSLGTGIDPLEEIDKHGADAVRFGLLAMSSTQDVRYSSEKIEQGQSLANKLFNASRFVLLNADAGAAARRPRPTTRRGPLDPLAARAGGRRHDAADRRVRLREGRARALRLRLRRALRLVPGARQGPRVRRRRCRRRSSTCCARRSRWRTR